MITNDLIMEEKKEKNKFLMTIGILAVCGAALLFHSLSEFQINGDSTKLYPVFITIYSILGKYASCGILLFLGVFLIVFSKKKEGALQLIDDEENATEFVFLKGGRKFEIVRKLDQEEILYFEYLNLEIKEGQIYKHFWSDNLIYESESDEEWLNISRCFWKIDEPFYNTLLPEKFKTYKQLPFRFKDNSSLQKVKIEKLNGIINKYHFEIENNNIPINELVKRGLVEYFKIEDLTTVGINDLGYYESELFFSIVNPEVKCFNNELYIGEDKISIEAGYAIGAIELTRMLPAKELKAKFETRIISEELDIFNSSPKHPEFGVNRTRTVNTTMLGNKLITEERITITYENYVPNVKSTELYFKTILLLMNFIQENDKSIDIKQNKFYVLARENVTEMPSFEGNLEELIFQFAEDCKKEFTNVEIGYLFRNSVNVLKGKFAIHPNITNLYFSLFDFFDFRTSGHENYFYSLWE